VQSAVRTGAAHRLVQRGYLVVEGLAALVETATAVTQQILQQLDADLAIVLCQVRGVLEEVEQPATIAIGGSQKNLESVIRQAQTAIAQPLRVGQGTIDQLAHGRLVQTFQHIDACARQQCVVQFERRILGGGTDEDQGAVFNVRQEGVLLTLVETMHLVDEENGAAAILRRMLLSDLDGLANLLHAGQYGGN